MSGFELMLSTVRVRGTNQPLRVDIGVLLIGAHLHNLYDCR